MLSQNNQNNQNNITSFFLYLINLINELVEAIFSLKHKNALLSLKLSMKEQELSMTQDLLEYEKVERQAVEYNYKTLCDEIVNDIIAERNELQIQLNELQLENTNQFRELFWLRKLNQINNEDDKISVAHSI